MSAFAFSLHFIPLVMVAMTAAVIAGYALVRDPVEGRFEFVILAVAVGFWTVDTGWMMFLSNEVGLLFGYYVQAFSEWVTPALFLVFVASYSRNSNWLERVPVRLYLAGIPFVLLMASFTNPVHRLVLADITFQTTPFGYAVPTPGPLFYLGKIYAYTSLIAGLVILARISIRSRRITRKQVVALAVSILIIISTSIAQFTNMVPVSGFNYTLIAFDGFYAALGYLFLRRPALDIGPLARQRLIESLNTGAVILTSDQRIADFNAAAETAFPDIEEALGEHVGEELSPLFEEIPEDGAPVPVDTVTVATGEEEVEYSVEVDEVVEDDGEVRGYGVIMSDVTELRAAMRQLEEKSNQLDQFASMVSHDLRAPLSVAQTNTGFVMANLDDEDTIEFATEAHEALDRAEELVEDLLTLAREGRSIQDREYVSLLELATEARDTSPLTQEQSNVAVDDVDVYADPERLRTVMENLFRNAIDHVGEDANVEIGMLDDGRDGFYIEDDGPGIPDDQIDEVFEHGFTTHEEGTGLGLSIVDSIIDAHGWEISAEHGKSLGGARFEVDTGGFREDESDESTGEEAEA